jgi:hypothetical protein
MVRATHNIVAEFYDHTYLWAPLVLQWWKESAAFEWQEKYNGPKATKELVGSLWQATPH